MHAAAYILTSMTTLRIVGHEPLTAAVARRLRGLLAELRISQKEFGERTGWGRAYVYRRLIGETPIDTADLEHIQETTGIQVLYLVGETGPRYAKPTANTNRAPGDDGSSRLPDLNRRPIHYEDGVLRPFRRLSPRVIPISELAPTG